MADQKKVAAEAEKCIKLLPKSVEANDWKKLVDGLVELGKQALLWKTNGGPQAVFNAVNKLKHLTSDLADKAKKGELEAKKDGAEIVTILNTVRSLPRVIASAK